MVPARPSREPRFDNHFHHDVFRRGLQAIGTRSNVVQEGAKAPSSPTAWEQEMADQANAPERQAQALNRPNFHICNRIIRNAKPSICFYSHTPEGVFTFLSPSAKSIFGFTPEAAVGKNWRDVLKAPVETFDAVDRYDQACARGEIPQPIDAEIYHPERGSIIVEIQDGPVFDDGGRVVAIEGFVVDVTELRTFQRELENLVYERTAALEKANAKLSREIKEARIARERMFQAAKMVSLGTVVSGVAHEINNPTSFVMLNAQALKKIWADLDPILTAYRQRHGDFDAGGFTHTELVAEVPVLLDHIHQGAKRIKKIVDDLKSYARQAPVDLNQPVDLNVAAVNAINFTRNLTSKRKLHFAQRLAGEMPTFTGDPQRVEQVLINLLTNAVESYGDKNGTITMETVYDRPAGKLVCHVRDDGRGIEANDLSRIKDPFFTTKRDKGGMGMGLSVSAGIVDMHGGDIEITPNVDKGITVTVSFPVGGKRPDEPGDEKA